MARYEVYLNPKCTFCSGLDPGFISVIPSVVYHHVRVKGMAIVRVNNRRIEDIVVHRFYHLRYEPVL